MAARFDKKWFNPLYFILNSIIKDDSIRTVFVYGGKSSSKTVSISQLLAKQCYIHGDNTIAYRKESNIIPTTLKKSFNLAIESTRLYPAFEVQDRKYLCLNQHAKVSEIVLKGLDTEEKAKGVESYKYIYLDELNHFLQAEFEQFNLSLRGIKGQKIFASWNPVDENSWLKKDYLDFIIFNDTEEYGKLPSSDSFVKKSADGKTILIKTTYLDNYWIVGSPCGTYGYRDENLISEYLQLKTRNYLSYKVNVLGEWGKVVFGGEFLKDFKASEHVAKINWNPELAIHISWDENVNPYLPMGVFQIDGKNVYQIDEFCLKDPLNKVRHVCKKFKEKYPAHSVPKLFIYGDRTSIKESTTKEKGMNFFTEIENELIEYSPVRRIGTANPSVIKSGEFINKIFAYNYGEINLLIGDNCKTSIYDYSYALEAADGTIDKKTIQHPVTKVRYQEFGHCTDFLRYFMVQAFSNEYSKLLNGDRQIPSIVSTHRPFNPKSSY